MQDFSLYLHLMQQNQDAKDWLGRHANGIGNPEDCVAVTETGPSDLLQVRFYDPEIDGANPDIRVSQIRKDRALGILKTDFQWTNTQINVFMEGYGDLFQIVLPSRTIVYYARSINARHSAILVDSEE